MTEAEWLACEEPARMLNYLDGRVADDRKYRLFACACCRRIWDLIEPDLYRGAVELAERFADGAGRCVEWEKGQGNGQAILARNLKQRPEGEGVEEWERMLRQLDAERANLPEDAYFFWYDNITPEDTATWTLFLRADMPWVVSDFASRLRAAPYPNWKRLQELHLTGPAEDEWAQRHQAELSARAVLLRDIFGNPFRPVSFDPAWRTANVVALAQTIYEERELPSGLLDRTRLAILADALMDAGCDDPFILGHCRSEGPHVRGCWVIDLILGKQ